MYFGTGYFGPEPIEYYSSPETGYFGQYSPGRPGVAVNEGDIEKPLVGVGDIGATVPEGAHFGTLIKTTTDAIRRGAGWIELSTSMGGGQEPVGAEAYGKDAREALRDLAKANDVRFSSVHTPANIGNMSGYNPQERGFNDEHRMIQLEEVKKAVDFAADTGAQAVVVHTGEFQRDISDQPWAKMADGNYEFLSYKEEPGRAVLYMVDDRTGKLITEVRKSIVVHEPKFKTVLDEDGRERYSDAEGNVLDETKPEDLFKRVPEWDPVETKFRTKRMDWNDFVKRAEDWNQYNLGKESWRKDRKYSPEEMFFRSQMETRVLQARGSSLYHGRFYEREKSELDELKKAYNFFRKIEDRTPVDEQWKLMRSMPAVMHYSGGEFVPKKEKLPSEILKENIAQAELSLKYTREASAAADANADETYETMTHVVPVGAYAKEQTAKSYAEAAIHAMETTKRSPHPERPVYLAPENLFPEMGYGTHPDELIGLVQDARKKMVEFLTEPYIENPHMRRDEKGGIIKVPNPYYTGISKKEAENKADDHIKATLDTQHLGMWWKHFQAKAGETVDERKKRFDKWYMQQVEKMEKAGIIGHIHIVDSIGAGHHHLPVGQGDLPVKKAVEYLKKKGFKGTMVSEGYGEDSMFGPGRQLTETWRAFGAPIRHVGWEIGAPQRWSDIQHSYFQQMQSPYFIFGAYSPSNDWQLWSEVPLE